MVWLPLLALAIVTTIRPTSSLGFHNLVPEKFQACCGDEQRPDCGVVESIARGPDGNHYLFVAGAVYQVRMSPRGFPEVYQGGMGDERVWFGDLQAITGQTAVNRTLAAVLLSSEGQPSVLTVSKGGVFFKFKKLPIDDGNRDVEVTEDCHAAHPLFCDDSLGDLVDATVEVRRTGPIA